MKIVVKRATAVLSFFGLVAFASTFSPAQVEHLQRLTDLLVVAPRRRTLAELCAQELDGVDPSNLADFFRISPWDADALSACILEIVFAEFRRRVRRTTAPIFLLLDDSLSIKDKATRKLDPVDWFFDHKTKRPVMASNHISLSIAWENFYFPLLSRLCLRAGTVRKRNRQRKGTPKPKLLYKSKLVLAQELLQQVVRFLPPGAPVDVLFDSWYTSADLLKWIRKQGWHVIAGIKSNRSVSGRQLSAWHHELKGRPYKGVTLGLANGQQRTYWVREFTGKLRKVPGEVRLLISQKYKGSKTPRYFLCTESQWTCWDILTKYQTRWRIETDYWWLKTRLGLGDYRLQSYEAIEKWYAVQQLVLVYLYCRKYECEAQHGGTTSLSEVMEGIRREHLHNWLEQALEEVAQGRPKEEVLQRYLGLAAAQTG